MLLAIGVALIIGSAAGLALGFPAFFIADIVGSVLFAAGSVVLRAGTVSAAVPGALGVFVFAQIAYGLTLFLRGRVQGRFDSSAGSATRGHKSSKRAETSSPSATRPEA